MGLQSWGLESGAYMSWGPESGGLQSQATRFGAVGPITGLGPTVLGPRVWGLQSWGLESGGLQSRASIGAVSPPPALEEIYTMLTTKVS